MSFPDYAVVLIASSPMPCLPRVSQLIASVLDILTTLVHHSIFTPFKGLVFLGSDLLLRRDIETCILKSALGWITGTCRRADITKSMGIPQKVLMISNRFTEAGPYEPDATVSCLLNATSETLNPQR